MARSTLVSSGGGRATVAGHDVVRDSSALRSVIGLAGQFAAIDANLTGRENLVLVGQLYHTILRSHCSGSRLSWSSSCRSRSGHTAGLASTPPGSRRATRHGAAPEPEAEPAQEGQVDAVATSAVRLVEGRTGIDRFNRVRDGVDEAAARSGRTQGSPGRGPRRRGATTGGRGPPWLTSRSVPAPTTRPPRPGPLALPPGTGLRT